MHPGGLRLTERAARLCGLAPGDSLIDVGCGQGASVGFLRDNLGLRAVGIDMDAAGLPYPDGIFDAAMFECVLSVLPDAGAALREARRVVRAGGRLIVSDVYHKDAGTPWSADGLRTIVESAGFGVIVSEDHTPALVTYRAERYAAGERTSGCAPRGLGYILLIAARENGSVASHE
jgi:ubiquinone/menaquinone biosynthesis C-methylase UbiE